MKSARSSFILPVRETQTFELALEEGVKRYVVKTRGGVSVAVEVRGRKPVKFSARSRGGKKLRTFKVPSEMESFGKKPRVVELRALVCVRIIILDLETADINRIVVADITICVR